MSAGSEVLEDEDMFQGIMDDLATLHVLGVKLVILASVRFQVDRRLQVETGDIGVRVPAASSLLRDAQAMGRSSLERT